MVRAQVPPRALKVLEILEEAKATAAARAQGEWVGTMELARQVGLNFKVGINKLDHKKKPWKGLGFTIEREPDAGSSNYWRYRLAAYPQGWGAKDVPTVDGQERLFGTGA